MAPPVHLVMGCITEVPTLFCLWILARTRETLEFIPVLFNCE